MRVKINGVYTDVPDDVAGQGVDAISSWADTQKHTLPAPIAPDPAPAQIRTAPVPPAFSGRSDVQGSNSNWILPDEMGRIGSTAPLPTGPAPVAALAPASIAPVGPVTSEPLPAPLVAPISPVTSAPLPPVVDGAPPVSPDQASPPGGAPVPKTVKINGQPVPIPADIAAQGPDAIAAWADEVNKPTNLGDALTRLPPAVAGGAPSPAPQFVNPVSPVLPPVTQPGKDAWIPPDAQGVIGAQPAAPAEPARPRVAVPVDPLIGKLTEEIARAKQLGGNEGVIRAAETALANAQARQAAAEAQANPPTPAAHNAFMRGLLSSFRTNQPNDLAEALEGVGVLSGNQGLKDAAEGIRGWTKKADPSIATTGSGILDAKSFDDLMTSIGETTGGGAASTAPSLIASLIGTYGGARIGGKTGGVIGGLGAAAVPSLVPAFGETYKALKDAKIAPEDAAKWAAYAAGPIAGLDVVGIEGILGKSPLGKALKSYAIQSYVKRIVAGTAEGAIAEGTTEGMQQSISDAVVAYKSGDPFFSAKNLKDIAENVIGGALVGGPAGGGHAAIAGEHGEAVPQPQPEVPPVPVPTQQQPRIFYDVAPEPAPQPAPAGQPPAQPAPTEPAQAAPPAPGGAPVPPVQTTTGAPLPPDAGPEPTPPPQGGPAGAVAPPGEAIPGQAPSQPGAAAPRLANTGVETMVRQKAEAAGIDPDYMVRMAQIESSGNPAAAAKGSSAKGLYQFIDGTWKTHGQGDVFNASDNTDAAIRLTRENMDGLSRALGRNPEPWELYLAHQQGLGGAIKLLSNPNASAASLVGEKAVTLNGGTAGMTAAEFAGKWRSTYNKTPGGAVGSAGGDAGTVGTSPAPASASEPLPSEPTEPIQPGETAVQPGPAGSAGSAVGAPATAAEPAPLPGAVTSPQVPEFNQLSTDAGQIRTKPIVVDMAAITHSGQEGYDQALQPRDRSRAASETQIAQIAGNLDPARITSLGPESDRGAPIVNAQGMVESGNGRVMALQQAYERGLPGGQAYRDHLQSLGFDTTGMANPVLVQQRMTPLTTQQMQQFVQGANAATTLRMGTTEQAVADSRRVTPDMLKTLATGRDPSTNPAFRKAFMQGIPTTEQAAMVGPDGNLNAAGVARVKAAVLTSAYGSSPTLERMLESTDDNTKSLSAAMMEAAPEMAQVKAGIADQTIDPSFDQSAQIADAVQRISEIRAKGGKVHDYLAQQDAFNPVPPDVETWMRIFTKDNGQAASKAAVSDAMRWFAEEALKTSGQDQSLGLVPPVTPKQLLSGAGEVARGTRQRSGGQGELGGLGERGSQPSADRVAANRDAGGPEVRPARAVAVGGRQADQAGPQAERAAGPRQDQADRPAQDIAERPQRNEDAIAQAKRTKGKPRTGTIDGDYDRSSWTGRVSRFEDVFAAANVDPTDANLMPIDRQFEIAAKAVKSTFGLAHVERTPGSVSRFAVDQMKDGYRNLGWMANAIGLPSTSLGLNGHFGLTLRGKGRGRDSYYGAYYPRGTPNIEGLSGTATPTIVLPDRSRSFGHEWGHALDYWITQTLFPGAKQRKGLSDVIKAMKRPELLTKQGNLLTPELQRVAYQMGQVVEAMYYKEDGSKSDFLTEVESYSGDDYWKSAREMFARTFEAYLANQVEQAGGSTEFITKNGDLYETGAGERFEKTFPKNLERIRLFTRMSDLMAAVAQTKELVGDAALPPGNALTLPSAWERIVGPAQTRTTRENLMNEAAKLLPVYRAAASILGSAVSAARHPVQSSRSVVTRATYLAWNHGFRSIHGNLRAIEGRTKSTALREMIDHLAPPPGSKRIVAQTYEEARNSRMKHFHNVLGRIIRRYDVHKFTADETAKLHALMTTGGEDATGFKKIEAPQKVRDAAVQLRALMDKMFYYVRDAGLEIGYTRNGYLPRLVNEDAVETDPNGFQDAATELYGHVFDADIAPDTAAMMEDLTHERWNDFMELAREAVKGGAVGKSDYVALRKALQAAREETTDETTQALSDALDAVFPDTKNHFASTSATNWYRGITEVGLDAGVDRGHPPMRFTKKRTLPPQADRIMHDYMHNDPVDLVARYITRSTRTAEIVRRFGRSNEDANRMIKDMHAEGVRGHELEFVKAAFLRVTGQEKRNNGYAGRAQVFTDSVYALAQAGMLVRSLFTNLLEPGVAGLRTGRVTDIAKPFYYVGATAIDRTARFFGGEGSSTTQYYDDLARLTGVVSDSLVEQVVADRNSGAQEVSDWVQKRTAAWFENIGLAGYTRWSRTGAQRVGVDFIQRQAEDYLRDPTDTAAIQALNELGIPEDRREDFASWYTTTFRNKGKIGLSMVELEDDPYLPMLNTALVRFTDQALQDPKRIDKPYLATTRFVSAFFSLQSFAYSFFNNIVMRAIRATMTKESGLAGKERALMLAKGVPLLMAYFTMHALGAVLRSFAYDDEEKRKKLLKGMAEAPMLTPDGKAAIYQVLARSGMMGPLERLANLLPSIGVPGTEFISQGSRYELDIPKQVIGPVWGSIATNASKIMGGLPQGARNSPNTTTSEFQAARGVFDTLAMFGGPILLGGLPPGIVGAVLGVGGGRYTTPGGRDTAIETITDMHRPGSPAAKEEQKAATKARHATPEYKQQQAEKKAAKQKGLQGLPTRTGTTLKGL
jgi:hypothetical protein